jgi:hypothetical protein
LVLGRAFAAWAKRFEWSDATARKIRSRLEWLALKSATKIVPLLSRKACYRLDPLLDSLGAILEPPLLLPSRIARS